MQHSFAVCVKVSSTSSLVVKHSLFIWEVLGLIQGTVKPKIKI